MLPMPAAAARAACRTARLPVHPRAAHRGRRRPRPCRETPRARGSCTPRAPPCGPAGGPAGGRQAASRSEVGAAARGGRGAARDDDIPGMPHPVPSSCWHPTGGTPSDPTTRRQQHSRTVWPKKRRESRVAPSGTATRTSGGTHESLGPAGRVRVAGRRRAEAHLRRALLSRFQLTGALWAAEPGAIPFVDRSPAPSTAAAPRRLNRSSGPCAPAQRWWPGWSRWS